VLGEVTFCILLTTGAVKLLIDVAHTFHEVPPVRPVTSNSMLAQLADDTVAAAVGLGLTVTVTVAVDGHPPTLPLTV
jgi:hypothetical protein